MGFENQVVGIYKPIDTLSLYVSVCVMFFFDNCWEDTDKIVIQYTGYTKLQFCLCLPYTR